MDIKELCTSLGKLSMQILFIKMAIPMTETYLEDNQITVDDYKIESCEENIYVTGIFKQPISEPKLMIIRDKLKTLFPHSQSNCGLLGFSIEIK